MRHFGRKQGGFSLIQVSIILAVGAILMVALLPGGGLTNDSEKIAVTMAHMAKIEEATHAFMVANLRRPCPADASQNNSSVGFEGSTPGSCTTGLFQANFSDNNTVAGGVPTKTLGLSDEYMLDGYGRRIMYMVDRRATAVQTCHDLQSQGASGAIQVSDGSSGVNDNTMWALISYGKDGHGAYSIGGGSARFNAGNTNADKLTDAFVNGAFTTTYADKLVRRSPDQVIAGTSAATRFDDIVWYLGATQNSCCMGPQCSMGFTAAGTATGLTASPGVNVAMATGDINGDGYPDLVIGLPHANGGFGTAYVLFGSPVGWAVGGQATAVPFSLAAITNTFATITSSTNTSPVQINAGYPAITNSPVFVSGVTTETPLNDHCYLGTGTGSNLTLKDAIGRNIDGTGLSAGTGGYVMAGCGAIINNDYSTGNIFSFGKTLAVGDVNGDGYDDILIGGTSYFTVVFGSSSFHSINVSGLAVSAGIPNRPGGFLLKTGTNTGPGDAVIANISGHADATKDMVFSDTANHAYVVFGSTGGFWQSCPCSNFGSTPNYLDLLTNEFTASGYGFSLVTSDSTNFPFAQDPGNSANLVYRSLLAADVNNDGIDDIIMGANNTPAGGGYVSGAAYVLFGRPAGNFSSPVAGTWAFENSTSAAYAPAGDTACSASYPCVNWESQLGTVSKIVQVRTQMVGDANFAGAMAVGDLDNDGVKDLLFASHYYLYAYKGGSANWSASPVNMVSYYWMDITSNRPTWVIPSPGTNGIFPATISVGDVNNDGLADILLGSFTSPSITDPNGRTSAGVTFVMEQPTAGWFVTPEPSYGMFGTSASTYNPFFDNTGTAFNNGASAFRISGAFNNDDAYSSLVLDLNGDAKNDILIGADHNNGSSPYGAVYTVWGRNNIPWTSSGTANGNGIDLSYIQ